MALRVLVEVYKSWFTDYPLRSEVDMNSTKYVDCLSKLIWLCCLCYLQDEKELISNLSPAMDGPEALMDADEYLQPKSRAPLAPALTTSSSSSSPPRTPIKTCWPVGTPVPAESPTPQNQQNWDRELMRYAGSHPEDPRTAGMRHLNGQPAHHHHASDSSSSRYCSDPLKLVGNRGQCHVKQIFLNPKKPVFNEWKSVTQWKLLTFQICYQ